MRQEVNYKQNDDGTITVDGKTGNPMYVIYDHPKDFPDYFVVRPWIIGMGEQAGRDYASTNGYLFKNLDKARKFIPEHMVRVQRSVGDDPVIVEVYI